MGSPRSKSADVGPFKVTEAWFPAGLVLAPHLHDRTTFATMLEGSFDLSFARRAYDCKPSSVFTEPLGEKHGNKVGAKGAHVLVVQPDHSRTDLFDPCRKIFDRPTHLENSAIASLAWRIAYELRDPDSISKMAIQGLGLEMLARATRSGDGGAGEGPSWLPRAVELIRAHFLDDLDTANVAAEVGVHPAHLARVFRRTHRESLGSYVRRLRLEWAAGELARSDRPIAEIALEAGFSDQSHLTRAFKRHSGETPAAYRRTIRT